MVNFVPVLMKKVGCSAVYDDRGELCLVTVVSMCENYIAKIERKDGDVWVGIACSAASKHVKKPQSAELLKYDLKGSLKLRDFRVDESAINRSFSVELAEGLKLDAGCFSLGDVVDVTGISLGKGFAGVMKRHNFAGLRASHGVSIAHRSHGSTGQCQDAGKVFKGKKMAGHMGSVKVTAKNLKVVSVDRDLGLMALYGSVPGPKGGRVFVRKARG